MNKMIKVLCLCFLCFLMVACGLTSPVKLPPVYTYTLSSVLPTPQASTYHRSASLLVSMPVASAGYDSNHLIYEPLPFDLRAYADHQWAAPPAQMLMPLLAQAVRNQGYFKAVVTVPYSGMSQYHLETQLIALKQSFLKPVSAEIVTLQATLVNSQTHHVIASRQFTSTVRAPGNDPYSGVVAANQGIKQLTNFIARWVVRSVR